jgi:hypothetical protein
MNRARSQACSKGTALTVLVPALAAAEEDGDELPDDVEMMI